MLGLDALEQFSAWRKTSLANSINNEILVIGMSSTAVDIEQKKGFQNGMHFFFRKPMNVEHLKNIISYRRSYPKLEQCLLAINESSFMEQLS